MTVAGHFTHALDRAQYSRDRLGIDPDPWQAEFLNDEEKRILLCCSRQSGKTTMAAIRACHQARFYPGSLTLILSPSLRQSSEMFRDVVTFARMDDLMPERLEENKLSMTLANGSRIVSLPAKEGTVRGYKSVSLIIEDEASQVVDELYYSVRPMLAVSGGALLLLSTPHGKRGHFWHAYNDDHWKVYEVKADMCPRIGEDFLQEEREVLPEAWYLQEYFCAFMEVEGQVFSAEEIDSVFTETEGREFFEILEEPENGNGGFFSRSFEEALT